MSLVSEVKNDLKSARNFHWPWWSVVGGIIGLQPIIWLFYRFGRVELFLPTFNSIVVLGFVIAVKRKLWRDAWFWVTMTIVATLNAVLILYVPWGTKWVPALAIAGLDTIGVCAILWILAAIGKFVQGRS